MTVLHWLQLAALGVLIGAGLRVASSVFRLARPTGAADWLRQRAQQDDVLTAARAEGLGATLPFRLLAAAAARSPGEDAGLVLAREQREVQDEVTRQLRSLRIGGRLALAVGVGLGLGYYLFGASVPLAELVRPGAAARAAQIRAELAVILGALTSLAAFVLRIIAASSARQLFAKARAFRAAVEVQLEDLR